MVQPFLTAPSLDVAASISIVAFAVAIPILAALILVNREGTFHGRPAPSILVTLGESLGQGAAFVGIVAAFWHMTWIAGVAVLVSAFVALGIHSAGWTRLNLNLKQLSWGKGTELDAQQGPPTG